MNAKEERNHNLEIHKMTRSNNELTAKNAALDAECMRLRVAIKQESEKYAASHAAMMKQFNVTTEVEREKMNTLQRKFDKERERLTEDAYKDAVAQRAEHRDALGDIKRHLDARYNEKVNENKIALDAAIRHLDEERERINRDEQEQHAQLNEEREQIKRQLNEGRERIKRDEREQLVQFLFYMDSEREKNQCQLEKERALMMEQVHNETVAQRQSNADMLAETKMLLDAKYNAKMNELNIKIQESNEEREQLRKTEEERVVQLTEEREQLRKTEEERVVQLTEEREQLRKNEEERVVQLTEEREQLQQTVQERLVQLTEEREKIKRDEKEQHEQFLIYMDSERENAQCQMEKERAQARENDVAQRQFNEDALAEMKMQLDEKCNIAFDSAMRQLDKEREQLKQQLDKERERNMRDDLEREKIHALQLQLENDRILLMERAHKDDAVQRQSNADALAETKRQMDVQFNEQINKNKIAFDTAMQQLNEERVQIKRMLTEERERNKQDDLEREKMNTFQRRLEKERELLFEQAQKDAVAQRQSNMDAIAETKRQLDAQFNIQMNKNKLALDAAMQKLNEERDQLKQHEQNMNESFRKKMQMLQGNFEKKLELLAEQARKDDALQHQNNAVILKEAKKQQDAQFNEQMNKNKIVFDAAMQKLNECQEQLSLDRKKMHDALGKERELLAEQARKDAAQCNADDKIKCDEQQQIVRISTLMEEITQLKKQSNEDREKHAQSKRRLKMDKSEIEHMDDAIDSNYAHMLLIHTLNFTDKRVMLYSHYSDKNEVESYNLLTIECVQHYFDYIIILTNCPNKWNMHSPNYNKCHLLAYNMKSDFRNYGVFIIQTAKTLVNASRLCLINDSFVIVDVNVFGLCIKHLFDSNNMSHDFVGLTSSHEGIFHLQSYFMCFNSTTLPAIMSYFETRGLPINHQSAISHYEMGITSHLIDKGFSSFAVVSNDDMRHPLNTTCCKWSAVLNDIGIIKRQHFFKRYAYAAMTDANIALVAENYSYNKHLMHFLKYNGIPVIVA